MSLQQLIGQLYTAFEHSKTVQTGGPGGMPVRAGNEIWNVGMSPSRTYFASNAVSTNSYPFISYHIGHDGVLYRNQAAVAEPGGGWRVDLEANVAVTSEAEVKWLIQLLVAIELAEWDAEVDLPPRPEPERTTAEHVLSEKKEKE